MCMTGRIWRSKKGNGEGEKMRKKKSGTEGIGVDLEMAGTAETRSPPVF